MTFGDWFFVFSLGAILIALGMFTVIALDRCERHMKDLYDQEGDDNE